ncbi:MAG: hypothetical protein PVI92_00180 [Chromatiales bacterium]|jgi:hypothetical protein
MKILSLLLLLPALALAQQSGPGAQMDHQQFFDQSKKMMLPAIEESLPLMREARRCLQAAENQEDLQACGEIMGQLQEKMQARTPSGVPEGQESPMTEPKDIEWDEETKRSALLFLERSILVGSAMQECFNQSSGMEQMQQCMQAKKPKP